MIARSLLRTTARRSCTLQPSRCHCTPGSAVPFAPFYSPLSPSLCAFAQGTLPQAFRGQCTYLKTL